MMRVKPQPVLKIFSESSASEAPKVLRETRTPPWSKPAQTDRVEGCKAGFRPGITQWL